MVSVNELRIYKKPESECTPSIKAGCIHRGDIFDHTLEI